MFAYVRTESKSRQIVGAAEQEASHFLEASGNNLDLALDLYFQNQPNGSSNGPEVAASSSRQANGGTEKSKYARKPLRRISSAEEDVSSMDTA